MRECALCHTPHHESCWDENGGCTTFGCNGQASNTLTPAAQTGSRPTTDHIELSLDDLAHCAACGAELTVWDTTCRRCNTSTSLPPSLTRPQQGQRPQTMSPYTNQPTPTYQQPMGNYYQPYANLPQRKSPIAACLLNLLLLGAGYFYLNQIGKGFAVLLIGLALGAFSSGVLIIAMLVYAMVDCYQVAEKMNRGVL